VAAGSVMVEGSAEVELDVAIGAVVALDEELVVVAGATGAAVVAFLTLAA